MQIFTVYCRKVNRLKVMDLGLKSVKEEGGKLRRQLLNGKKGGSHNSVFFFFPLALHRDTKD